MRFEINPKHQAEQGATLINLLLAILIAAILASIFVPAILPLGQENQEAYLTRTAYKTLQEWTDLAVLQGGATLENTGKGLKIIGAQGKEYFIYLPPTVTVSLTWNAFPSGACQSLDGNGVPIINATTDCSQPILNSTNTVPLLAFCLQGVCYGAHS